MTRTLRQASAAALLGLSIAMLPVAAFAAEEEAGGIAALGFSLPGLITQLVNFAILLVVLRVALYGPILKVLDERKRRIQEGIDRASEAASAAANSEVESRRAMEAARAEGQAAVARATEAAARLREELETRARAEADGIVARAREEIAQEREQAIEQIRREFADLAITAAERVIEQSLDRSAHQRLIDQVLADSQLGQRS
ncbi:MAG: ATP synthase F0 subunit B [Chloroflexi bacterium]|nr:MAG: ATP synthase F0 subunit B [Chloroflexota bacterium]